MRLEKVQPVRVYPAWAVAGCLVLILGCQSGAPIATTPASVATPGELVAATSTPALGIDFRVPPTRAPRTSPAAVLSPPLVQIRKKMPRRYIHAQTSQKTSRINAD